MTSGPTNSTILLRSGSYSTGFTVPANTTVKPYNCETVQVNDNITLSNGSTVAGFSVTANNDGWALQITNRTNVTVRNMNIRGGNTEAIRIDGSTNGVLIIGSLVDGGRANHAMKIRGNPGVPTNVTIMNTVFSKLHFGGGEDLLQLEQHGVVTVSRSTFGDNSGEDGVDIKSAGSGGSATFTANLFEGDSIDEQCFLINGGNPQPLLVEGNLFEGCTLMLGANNSGNPTATIRGNLLTDNSTMHLRRSANAVVDGNDFDGDGTLRLGTTTSGDQPKTVTIRNNDLTGVTFSTVSGATWTCDGSNTGSTACD